MIATKDNFDVFVLRYQTTNIENMVDIKDLKNFIMQQFVDFKYRIW
jgi:hypothetical protein